MFKALLWKEWRQLRGIRWAGIALGALLPVAFVAGAEMGRRGVAPFGRVVAYQPATLFAEVLPATVALALWPFVAVMAAAQAYAGDRAAGVETFLLERPVSRRMIWLGRLAGASSTIFVVGAATAAIVALVMAMTGTLGTGTLPLGPLAAFGGGGAVVALIGGITAASFGGSPLLAVLTGAVASAAPLLLGIALAARFPFAEYRGAPLGLLLPWLLLPAYVVASLRGTCSGEPFGRGRVKRMAVVILVTVAASTLLFVIAAPMLARAEAARGRFASVRRSVAGDRQFISCGGWTGDRGWLVDVPSGRQLAFVAPPLWDAAAKPDGSAFAFFTESAPFGGIAGRPRLEIRDAEGRITSSTAKFDEGVVFHELTWAGDRLVAARWKTGSADLVIIDPRSGAVTPTGLSFKEWPLRIVRGFPDGSALIVVGGEQVASGGGGHEISLEHAGVQVFRVAPGAGRVEATPVLHAAGSPFEFDRGISPDGRYAVVARDIGGAVRRRVVEIATGEDVVAPCVTRGAVWLGNDRLAWIERRGDRSRLVTASLGESGRAVREWATNEVRIGPSPDGKLLLVAAFAPGESRGAAVPSSEVLRDDPSTLSSGDLPTTDTPALAVWEPTADRWIETSVWRDAAWIKPFRGEIVMGFAWAGPRTLQHVTDSGLAFEDLDRPGVLRLIAGALPDRSASASR